jgi:F-type H+-transporting ATPase subunit a
LGFLVRKEHEPFIIKPIICKVAFSRDLECLGLGMVILLSLIFVSFVFFALISSYYFLPSRFGLVRSFISSKIGSYLGRRFSFWVVYVLFLFLFVTNLIGNFPLSSVPTLFYSETLTLSLAFWCPIIACVYLTQLKFFLSHILPYGSPAGLMLFLPLVEIFSQLIRPLTLIIRLRTNLSRGHIMLYIFSYFTLLSDRLIFVITPVLGVLFILEICISALQAYIFFTLISLYVVETI